MPIEATRRAVSPRNAECRRCSEAWLAGDARNSNGYDRIEQPQCLHRPEVYSGMGEGRAAELLQAFFRARR